MAVLFISKCMYYYQGHFWISQGLLKSNYKNQRLSGLKVDILHLNFQWESLDIEGEVAIV